jgi:alkyldihydroxyacetonephosphate synthase
MRLYDRKETKRHFGANGNENCMLLLLSEGPTALVKAEMDACYEICMQAGGFDWGEKPVEHWLGKRFEVPDLRELALDKGVVFDTIEVAANWDKVGPLYDGVIRALKQVPGVLMASGHSSHSYQQGTCLYFTFAVKKPNWLPRIIARALSRGRLGRFDQPQDLSAVEASYYACWSAVMKAVLANGGTISHHHGVGRVRQEWIEEELGTSYAVLKRVKQALDPDGIMNPGTLFKRG